MTFSMGGRDLRLNPELVTSDVSEFSAAVSQGRLEAAAGHYTGAFLERVPSVRRTRVRAVGRGGAGRVGSALRRRAGEAGPPRGRARRIHRGRDLVAEAGGTGPAQRADRSRTDARAGHRRRSCRRAAARPGLRGADGPGARRAAGSRGHRAGSRASEGTGVEREWGSGSGSCSRIARPAGDHCRVAGHDSRDRSTHHSSPLGSPGRRCRPVARQRVRRRSVAPSQGRCAGSRRGRAGRGGRVARARPSRLTGRAHHRVRGGRRRALSILPSAAGTVGPPCRSRPPCQAHTGGQRGHPTAGDWPFSPAAASTWWMRSAGRRESWCNPPAPAAGSPIRPGHPTAARWPMSSGERCTSARSKADHRGLSPSGLLPTR